MSTERKIGQRIVVRGTSGSGKSTLGRTLAKRLNIPHTEIDSLYHLPKWQPCPAEEFQTKVSAVVSGEAWVIDGNYSKVSSLIMNRVDTVIWLDYPLPIILWRLIRRIFRRGLRKEVLWNGNQEVLYKHFFTRDSLILWVFQTYRKRHRESLALMSNPELTHLHRHRFTHPRDLEAWLRDL